MSNEWGPWIEHDGKGCPCVGQYVHVVVVNSYGFEKETFVIAGSQGGKSWDWRNAPKYTRIIRYRIHKPRGLTILENLIADLPAPAGPKVTA